MSIFVKDYAWNYEWLVLRKSTTCSFEFMNLASSFIAEYFGIVFDLTITKSYIADEYLYLECGALNVICLNLTRVVPSERLSAMLADLDLDWVV